MKYVTSQDISSLLLAFNNENTDSSWEGVWNIQSQVKALIVSQAEPGEFPAVLCPQEVRNSPTKEDKDSRPASVLGEILDSFLYFTGSQSQV